jgi:hypothetical protein
MRRTENAALRLCFVLLLPLLVSCDTVGGTGQDNVPPESVITEPVEPSGTLTVADGSAITIRWRSIDPEEQSGEPGGIAAIEIRLDGEAPVLFQCPPDSGEWWFSSSADSVSDHFISSENLPTGGNSGHCFRVRARDIAGCWESPTESALYVFSYNFPPTSEILSPQPGELVGFSFTITWKGVDTDGNISAYQYVLDPQVDTWHTTADTFASFTGVDSGAHQFVLRARDNAGCWEEEYQCVGFDVN